jgi:hypothetical protein
VEHNVFIVAETDAGIITLAPVGLDFVAMVKCDAAIAGELGLALRTVRQYLHWGTSHCLRDGFFHHWATFFNADC